MLLRSALLASIVAAAPLAHAEPIDEAAFVTALEAHDPRLAVAAAQVATARAEVAAARTRPNPSISIEREEPFVDGTGLATSYLRLAVPIEISGRRGEQIAAAETGVRAAQSEAGRVRFEAIITALGVFDEAIHARLYVQLLTESRTALVRAVDIARQRGKTGAASGYEVQRFELELAIHDDELAEARIALARARAQLAMFVDRPGEIDAAGDLALPGDVPPVAALLGIATARGDLRGAQLRERAARQRAGAADRGWMPLPTLTAGAMTADLGTETGTGYVAGIALSIPIFDRGQGEGARAGAERQRASAEARWLARAIPAGIARAHATLIARIAQARQVAQRDRLDIILRAAETAFREGTVGVVELLDAHRAARAVNLRALELRYRVARDKRELELAVGQRL